VTVPGWFYIGYCHTELGNHLEGLDAYERAIGIRSDDAQTYYYLGAAYNHLGRHLEAIEACKKAVSIKPNLAEAYSVMGLSYIKLRRSTEAIEAFNKAIQARPDYEGYDFTMASLACTTSRRSLYRPFGSIRICGRPLQPASQ
jgi:tetratricopeptide (TPR) repeat protein